MKRWHYILGGVGLLFLGIQLIPTDLPPVVSDNPGDIMRTSLVNQDVAALLKTSCYSCHSNETTYPWYSHVAPASWLVARDVREGRDELNFSIWQDYDPDDILGILDDISVEVGEGRMPMKIYTFMHPSASLDDAQREKIVAWAEAAMDTVAEELDAEDTGEEDVPEEELE
ncbi:MAG: heme-binding domain-containing protein [Cyclobacteriaceae bacterium]|nr:heme-binding domain-containing protein [Cyclobacteriaceae bacterium]